LFRLFAELAGQRTPQAPDNQYNEWLKRAMDYIHMHFRDAIKVHDVARFVGVDRTHFTRTFHQAQGMSPHAYIQHLKLTEARELLLNSGMSIKEIAASLGYSDPYTFSRAFKRKYGHTPSAVPQ
jgi:AraC-like DNA-binding protein